MGERGREAVLIHGWGWKAGGVRVSGGVGAGTGGVLVTGNCVCVPRQ